ncbi:MAG: hypothetical protein EZS28_052845 [Streblomastix strix]|uniref:Uncharacterized protein n=1 Tax=Streblomastix strix TaxID=222440 RepID=A0A5J4RSQ7_9EUKA|nr:MAG: hypothetical protein EZS28_052845 [Streblomastix strix]
MLRDREMALDALGMNSDKVPKYNSCLDLLGVTQNSVNGVNVVRTAAAGTEALIANDLLVVMDVLLTQHHVGRIIAGDRQEQLEVAVAPPQPKFILAGNAGLSNLIGEESIDRLLKAQNVAKAVGVVQNQQRIQPRPAYNHFVQIPCPARKDWLQLTLNFLQHRSPACFARICHQFESWSFLLKHRASFYFIFSFHHVKSPFIFLVRQYLPFHPFIFNASVFILFIDCK